MQNTQHSQHSQHSEHPQGSSRRLVTLSGLTVAALGFLMSFVLAMLMLIQLGNPGFLLIWLAAIAGTATCMRAHARWRKSFERMYAPETVRTFYPSRRGWQQSVEDVVFRDLPEPSMSFGR